MSLTHSVLSVSEILQELNQSPDILSVEGKNRQCEFSQISSQICQGSVQRWWLRSGLSLIIRDLEFLEPVTLQRESPHHSATLGISFCVAGTVKSLCGESQKAVQLQAGQASLGTSLQRRKVEYDSQQRVMLVHLHLHPDALSFAHKELLEQMPLPLKNWLTRSSCSAYFHTCAMTTVMKTTVWQIIHCPYQGFAQRLYLEGKTIELIGLYLDQLLSDQGLRQNAYDLNAEEVNRIFQARDILLQKVHDPPTLLELAHQLGLNDRKLKEGFRKVFGTTVFGYLRQYQMEEAKQLLLLPGMTIARVAQAVGYRNPEAFSVAFRRTFAITPKSYQQQYR